MDEPDKGYALWAAEKNVETSLEWPVSEPEFYARWTDEFMASEFMRAHDAQVLRDAADYLDHDPGGNSASFKLRIRAQRVERGE